MRAPAARATSAAPAAAPVVSLRPFRLAVFERLSEVLDSPQLECDRRLLKRLLWRLHPEHMSSGNGEPLSLLHTVARAWATEVGPVGRHVGAFCLLHLTGLGVIDDVQDEDLAETAFRAMSPGLALNYGFTLLALGLEELRLAAQQDPVPERRQRWLGLLSSSILQAVAGQHRDLECQAEELSPEQVQSMHTAKTSSVALVVECGAALGGAPDRVLEHYRRFGACFSQVVQIIDDLRDIYGKQESPDLSSNRATYPLACFFQRAAPEDRVAVREALAELPGSLATLRRILYASGAVGQCAATVQSLQRQMGKALVATGNRSRAHERLMEQVEAWGSLVYRPSSHARQPLFSEGLEGFGQSVARAAARFVQEIRSLGLSPPDAPRLVPWRAARFEYRPGPETLHFPDLDDPECTAVESAAYSVLGDSRAVRAFFERFCPLMVAHEMFHHWRKIANRLGTDEWEEERVANRLAAAYAWRFQPALAAAAFELFEGLAGPTEHRRHDCAHSPQLGAAEWLPPRGSMGELDAAQKVQAHLHMLREFLSADLSLEVELQNLLGVEVAA